jgi:hypothetical protein
MRVVKYEEKREVVQYLHDTKPIKMLGGPHKQKVQLH